MATHENKPEKSLDRRQRRTRKLMKQAFKELIQERDYEAISVTDISERADITRNTFYNHFESKDALLLNMIEDAIAAMFAAIDSVQLNAQLQRADEGLHAKKEKQNSLFNQDEDNVRLLKLGLERFAPTILAHYAAQQMVVLKQLEPAEAWDSSSLELLNLFVSGGTLALLGSHLYGSITHTSKTMDKVVAALSLSLLNHRSLADDFKNIYQS